MLVLKSIFFCNAPNLKYIIDIEKFNKIESANFIIHAKISFIALRANVTFFLTQSNNQNVAN